MNTRILLKALALFVAFNVLWALVNPLPMLNRVSLYNTLWRGRERFSYSDDPAQTYSVSLTQLDAMFATHEISAAPKPADEFRVVLIGDSSTWGFLLTPRDTLAGQLNALQLRAKDGRRMRVFNLGYPDFSLAKDVLILQRAKRYQPDLIVWLITPRSLAGDGLAHPIVQANADEWNATQPQMPFTKTQTLWERTLWAQRRDLADLARNQLYGAMWSATGIDQQYPTDYERAQLDLARDENFFDVARPLTERSLPFELIDAGVRAAGDTPLLVVHEPMLISNGANSDVRYNFFYPRWLVDDFRAIMDARAQRGLRYLDLWNLASTDEFTNSAVHLSPQGSRRLAERLAQEITR